MKSRSAVLHSVLGWIVFFATIFGFLHSSARADQFDWRNVNDVNWNTPIESQFAGTCWDFGPVGVMEAKYMFTRNDRNFIPDLSEQQVCWETDPDLGNIHGGGGTANVFSYFTTHGVVSVTECPTETNYVYWDSPGPGDPWPLASGWQNRCWRATGYQANISNNITDLKSAIKNDGPVAVGLYASEIYASVADLKANYQHQPNNNNHTVSLVGYCDDGTCPTGGYWIVKNSWGTGSGDNGYGYVPYNSSVEGCNDLNALGAVYYTGPMYHTGPWDATGVDHTGTAATNTWKGTTNGTWDTTFGTSGNWSNNSTGHAFTWVNQELQAVFDSTGSNKAITVSGTVIAHGLTIITSGYSFAPADSNSALTITSGGIAAYESVTINTPVSVGGPQAWYVASGKSLTFGGDVHTIISPLTLDGGGDISIAGSINGGGVLNQMGAAPGAIAKNGSGTLHLTGAATYSVPINIAAGSISFEQSGADVANFISTISGIGPVTKSNSGTLILSGANSYTGWTRIYGGVVQANVNAGVPNQSAVVLDGGVFQSNSAVTYTDKFWSEVPDYRCVSWWSGGFAGGGGKMTVNLRGNGSVVDWTGNGDTGIAGTMILSSTTAQYEVELKNALNLNGAERTIYVADNPNSTGDFATISGVIANGSGTSRLTKTGPGRLILSATNTYGDGKGYDAGSTKIDEGVLQADRGVGLSGNSGLILNGGVLQSNSTVTFTDPFYWGAGETGYAFSWVSGGFSAGGGKMTVHIGGSITTLNFGDVDGRAGIAGIMKLSSSTAQYETEIQNPVNLNGGARTIQVDDNPNSSGDFATLSGVIGDSASGGSLTKTGLGTLYLKGSASNTYSGQTTIKGGYTYLAKTGGAVAISGNILVSEIGDSMSHCTYLVLNGDNEIASSSVMTFTTPVAFSYFDLNGHQQTVAGINSDPWSYIEGRYDNTGLNTDSQLTVNNTADCTYTGHILDKVQGSGTGRLKLVKSGPGALNLTGASCSGYTGGLTVNAGTLNYSGASSLPSNGGSGTYYCPYTISGGTLNTGALSASIGTFLITGGTVTGSGALTSNADYDIRAGTVNVGLAGSVALNKTTSGTATLGGNNSALLGNITVSSGTLIGSCGFGGCAFGAGSTSRTIAVNSGATLTFATGDMFGGHATTAIPTFYITGGTISSTGLGVHEEFNNLTLSGGTLSAGSDAGGWAAWNINGTVTSYNTSTMNYTAGTGQIMLQSGDPTTPNTTFNVNRGTLTVSCPLIDGRSGTSPFNARATNLTKTGAGMLTLTGADNNYTGSTIIEAGTLALAGNGQIHPLSTIDNDATFLIADDIASHTLGTITGMGTTQLNDGAQLTATSIVQGTLTLGIGARVTIQPIPGGPLGDTIAPVPEPSTFMLLSIGIIGCIFYGWRQRGKT
jgi:autotransporter-associated beta strand protein